MSQLMGVLGAGTMGAGIAQVAAHAGYLVTLCDVSEIVLEKGKKSISESLTRLEKKGSIHAAEREKILGHIETSIHLETLKDTDFIIEAVTENLKVKQEAFRKLDKIVKPEAIFATNTSSLSVAELARSTSRSDKFIGMHFFNPVPIMKLVEVIRTPLTSDQTFQAAWELAKKIGKDPIIAKDTPGFIFNRLIIPYLNEAMWTLYEGAGSIQDIDKAMKLGGNMPIGPLQLLDLVGIDVQLHACETLFREFGDPKFKPCPLNEEMVKAGLLGRKTKRGFYDYSLDPPAPNVIPTTISR